jgi:D-psicose/D-tagatose/L-ribulose 3-epimerase
MFRPIGIHLSYWQTLWSDDLVPLIGKAREAGFDGAEFPLLAPTELDYPRLRAALDDLGMQATCGTGCGPTTDITSPDAAVRQAGIEHLRACLEGCVALGSPGLGGVTYTAWGVFPESDHAGYRQRCIESLREVGQIAGDLGVVLNLEVLNRFESYLINTVEQGLAVVEEVGSPHVKLHLDTFHQNIEEDDIGAAIRRAGNHIGHFHCSENNRKMPGAGHIPWSAVKAALDDVGYDKWLTIESFVAPGGEVGPALSTWRSLADDLDAEAKRGAAFVRREVAGV